jgi:glycerophosphoryl diester phosphodiesterase
MSTRQKLHLKGSQTKIIAHRGASGTAPENTLASIHRASHLGADFIEIDVRLTKDSIPVVLHDAEFKGVLPTQAIRELTYKETQEYDVGVWFDPSFKGERVPTLAKAIAACHNKTPLMLEIKREVQGPKAIATKVFEVLKNTRSQWQTLVVGSFCHKIVEFSQKIIHQSVMPIDIMGIVDELKNIDNFLKLGVNHLALSHKLITPELMHHLNKHDAIIWVYTVNDVERARELVHMGVHGIISNFPEKMKMI